MSPKDIFSKCEVANLWCKHWMKKRYQITSETFAGGTPVRFSLSSLHSGKLTW